jgi:formamidopyrimidine-DNA glycosylase
MPEGPEVAVLAAQLNEKLAGESVLSAESEKYADAAREFAGRTIEGVESRGKVLRFRLEGGGAVHNHLMLTGRWTTLPEDHVKLSLRTTGGEVCYCDSRGFGKFEYSAEARDWDAGVPDVLTAEPEEIRSAIARRERSTAASVLVNQQAVAGVGNYLRAEVLFAAKIHPSRKVGELSSGELDELAAKCSEIARESFESGGSAGYKDLYGNRGKYEFAVYQRETDPAGNRVARVKIAGRAVYYSPAVQRE